MPETADLIKFIRGLRAVREYTPEPIGEAVLREIIDVGRWSGSASNKQPTEIVVVRDRAVLAQIGDSGVRPAGAAAVALVVITSGEAETSDLELFDSGRLVERLLLAAKAHGLGANIGTLKGDGIEAVKKTLGVPAQRRAWAVVTIGHTDVAARKARTPSPTAGRKPDTDFVHWERF